MILASTVLPGPTNGPVVINSPRDTIALQGASAGFSVLAVGPEPLSYQWLFETNPISSATGSNCTIAAAQMTNNGSYRVVVTNSFGAVTSQVARLLVTAFSGTAYWDGGGDGTTWTDARNWSEDRVPGTADDVVIDLPTPATVTLSGGSTTVRSIQCSRDFVLSGGSLALTGGTSIFAGSLSLASGTTLSASGLTTIVNVNGAASINGANLYASGGAVLSLPGVKSYQSSSGTWQASGAGSRLVLAGLTNAVLGASGWPHYLHATGGGRVELPALVTLGDGRTDILADGTNSVVDLSSLQSCNPGGAQDCIMEARNGGTIVVPQLVQGRLQFTLRPDGQMALPALRQLWSGRLTVAPGMSVELPGLMNIDNSNLYVSGGAVLSLPGVRSYQSPSGTWQASGAGSRLVLAGLTNAVLGASGWPHYLHATGGGRVELPALVTLGDGVLDILADGTNSVVDLSSLQSYNPGGAQDCIMEARNGGTIVVPQLVQGRLQFTLRPDGQMALPVLRQLWSGRLTVAPGMSVELPGLMNIDNSNLYVSGGAVLSLPGVRSYQSSGWPTWQASGAGSRLVLAGLTNAVFGSGGSWHYIKALSGGRVELEALAVMGDGTRMSWPTAPTAWWI